MPDNVTVYNGNLSTYVVSSDEAASGHVQRVKLCYSADGSDTHVQADADGLLVAPNRVPRVASAALSSVNASTSSVQLAAANSSRNGLIIYNDSTATLRVAFASTASSTSFTYLVPAGGTLELMQPVYTGVVSGIWEAANGAARITQL